LRSACDAASRVAEASAFDGALEVEAWGGGAPTATKLLLEICTDTR
jgi:hypothetical protein